MPTELRVKTESLPERCEICHQSDLFDRQTNKCSRCSTFSNEALIKESITIKQPVPLPNFLRTGIDNLRKAQRPSVFIIKKVLYPFREALKFISDLFKQNKDHNLTTLGISNIEMTDPEKDSTSLISLGLSDNHNDKKRRRGL
jgi:hypothetical protein